MPANQDTKAVTHYAVQISPLPTNPPPSGLLGPFPTNILPLALFALPTISAAPCKCCKWRIVYGFNSSPPQRRWCPSLWIPERSTANIIFLARMPRFETMTVVSARPSSQLRKLMDKAIARIPPPKRDEQYVLNLRYVCPRVKWSMSWT